MQKPSVLIVEDEDDIRSLVSYNLSKEGYNVAEAATGEDALKLAEQQPFDLALLDLMLPGVDGLTVCRRLKGNPRTADIPVIMLTAKGEESDIVAGLNLGADDYITKPFSPRVLLARSRAVLRRTPVEAGGGDGAGGNGPGGGDSQSKEPAIRIHGLVIHPGRHQVIRDGENVELTSTEFRVLKFLASRPGWVFTRQQILDGVHGTNYAITDRAIDVQIVGLRKKLGEAGSYIETVRGVGYRFRE